MLPWKQMGESDVVEIILLFCNHVINSFLKYLIRSRWTGPPRLALAIRGPFNMLKCNLTEK